MHVIVSDSGSGNSAEDEREISNENRDMNGRPADEKRRQEEWGSSEANEKRSKQSKTRRKHEARDGQQTV